MIRLKFLNVIFALLILAVLSSCGIYKRSDVKDNPVNVNERVRKNIQEGRGVRFGKGATRGGDFDFASSNPLWRASIEIFDFVPLTNASYSGGIIITDWFSAENKNPENSRDLKITVKFLTNEITKVKKINSLIDENLDKDYLEILIRDKFVVGKKGENTYIVENE